MRNSRRGRSAANWRRRPSKRAGGTGSTRVPARTNPPSGGIAKVVSGYSLVIPAQAGAPLCLSLEFRFRGKDASGRERVSRPQHLIFRNAAALRLDGKRGSAGASLRSGRAFAVRLSSPVSRLCGKRERGGQVLMRRSRPNPEQVVPRRITAHANGADNPVDPIHTGCVTGA